MEDLKNFLSKGKEWFERYIITIQDYANKLQESEEWLSTTLSSIGDAVIATDKLGNVSFMNPVAETLTGWKKDEAIGKPLESIFSLKEGDILPDLFQDFVSETFNSNTPRLFELELNNRFYTLDIIPIKEEGYVNVYARDITERKKSEIEINHLNAVLKAIRNVNQLIIIEKDPSILIEKDPSILIQKACDVLIETRSYNNVWIALIDESNKVLSTAEAGLGESFLLLVEMLEKGEFSKCSQKAMAQSEVHIVEDPHLSCLDCPLSKEYKGQSAMIVRIQNGERIFGWISVSIPKEFIKNAEELSLLKEVADDIALALNNIILETKREQSEQALKKSEGMYHEAFNRIIFYKDLLSHDINNILQSTLSGMEINELLLEQPDKLEDLKKNMDVIKEQTFRGANLITQVRKLSQLEQSEALLKKMDICKLLKKSITLMKNIERERSKNIRVNSIGKELHVQANELLEDLFDNILINAVKHNENPTIEIMINISRDERQGINYIKMEFLDNGEGIDDTRKEEVFQRYSKEKSVHGMGLGLSLVKSIVNTYNGKVWVEDRVKGDYTKGSNFVLLVPEVK